MNPRARLRRQEFSAAPTKRVSSTPRNDNWNSQREIHHGTTPASTQGTNTKKMAVPMTAAALRMDTIRSLLISNHIALMSQSGHQRTSPARNLTSALPLKADLTRTSGHVRFVCQERTCSSGPFGSKMLLRQAQPVEFLRTGLQHTEGGHEAPVSNRYDLRAPRYPAFRFGY